MEILTSVAVASGLDSSSVPVYRNRYGVTGIRAALEHAEIIGQLDVLSN